MLSCSSHVRLFGTLWSLGFFRQEYGSGLPCPPPGNLPNPGIKLTSLMSPALAGRFFTTSATSFFFKKLIYLFWSEDKYFTILWWLLPFINMNWPPSRHLSPGDSTHPPKPIPDSELLPASQHLYDSSLYSFLLLENTHFSHLIRNSFAFLSVLYKFLKIPWGPLLLPEANHKARF